MIIRSFLDGFSISDWSEEVNVIPNQWGTINNLNIFAVEPVAEHVVQFEEIIYDGALIVDRIRGDRNNVSRDIPRKVHSFNVPHFPQDDFILPGDLQGKRAYGAAAEAEQLDAVRMRKMNRIRQNHAWTLEAARAQALTTGTAYSPNGTVNQNWFTEFARTQVVVDFLLGTSTTNVIARIESAIASIQDNTGSVNITGIVALCSPTFFAKLISHPNIQTAYQYYASTQEPLRQRLAAEGMNAPGMGASMPMHREFYFGGMRFIEMRDAYNGVPLIPAQTCVILPTGTEYFKTYFSPANRFGLVNTLGEEVYMFEYAAPNGTSIQLETESNHISALLKPNLVIAGLTSN